MIELLNKMINKVSGQRKSMKKVTYMLLEHLNQTKWWNFKGGCQWNSITKKTNNKDFTRN